jgi:hypothetical protein
MGSSRRSGVWIAGGRNYKALTATTVWGRRGFGAVPTAGATGGRAGPP